MKAFIEGMPKAELHVHLEGTLEPEHIFALAQRNNIELEYNTPEEVVAAYDFHDLPSFLKIYYAAMNVLCEEEDFYELTYQYFEKAAADKVVYCEPFFDPQGHTSRGVAFETIIKGIRRAQEDAAKNLDIESNLIMCFLRDMSAESAMEHLEMCLPYKDWIIGVGLDSDEKDNPPSKFEAVFARAREEGFKLTMHCDVNQKDIHGHIRECLDLIKVDRIDHGVNSLEDEELIQDIVDQGLGLTVCPVSNRFVVQSLTSNEIREMLNRGMKATVNSDDPAYFRAYMNDNFIALAEEGNFSQEDLVQLSRNAFDIAWLSDDKRQKYITKLEQYAAS
ncbi:MAG: adenosine deaminase [Pseudomonadales bacterium]|nr:adenosine deaminase [Pseudomonadales bacterium]MBO6564281.1 adenosine deaminase [Pseudomonadales bacterium]MBO6595106.1 adenosine deaminase [Pseudomonadales bacterium]MBO6657134.1 adenosine deaminase [Pseudomonadales bacterium]MBO6701611.1 adenosine deaminase [Pseudomonadales bacterium]